jgi:hypothetical protein
LSKRKFEALDPCKHFNVLLDSKVYNAEQVAENAGLISQLANNLEFLTKSETINLDSTNASQDHQ